MKSARLSEGPFWLPRHAFKAKDEPGGVNSPKLAMIHAVCDQGKPVFVYRGRRQDGFTARKSVGWPPFWLAITLA